MNRSKLESVPTVVPPALDVEESELAARNEFLNEKEMLSENDFDESGGAIETTEADFLDETDAASGGSVDEDEGKSARRAKRRKSLVFLVAFGAFFSVFVVFISWAFGFGFFAPAKRIAVDRNSKTNGVNSSPTATTGDEKLKTALALVANDTGNSQISPVVSDNSTNPNALPEQDLKLSSDGKAIEQANQNNPPSGNMIVLPDENSNAKSNSAQNQIRVAQQPSLGAMNNATTNLLAGEGSTTNSIFRPKANNSGGLTMTDKADGAVGRSVFFGSLPVKNNSASQNSPGNSSNFSSPRSATSNEIANVPSFGSLLPVRLLGAIYTLRGTGGLVRMELSRARGDSQENSFVVVKAGTEAYVLITDLPSEQRSDDANESEKLAGDGKLPGVNLSESEMAEILSTDNPDKIRAALLKMSPQFRALAIKAIEDGK